jgi:AraC-like DNA-binding protein
MLRSGTFRSSDPAEYQSRFRDARINLVFARYGEFKARVTWVELAHLHLLDSEESLPRIAYVSLSPEPVFVGFQTNRNSPLIWGGMKVGSGDIILHGRGERMHQQTNTASRWGLVSLAPEQLAAYGKALTGLDLVAPAASRVLRPPMLTKQQLLRLHAQACRLAETKPEMIAHPEVSRALDQELINALVTCLATNDVHDLTDARRRRRDIMVRFEEVLAERLEASLESPLRMADLCSAIGVTERTFRISCTEILGMGPSRYVRLQRLNRVRAPLQRADPATASVAELAKRHGFSELGRFAAIYRELFGETPSASLRRSRVCDAVSAETA